MKFKWYDVEGYDRPLMLSEEHAELIGGKEVETRIERPTKRAPKQTWIDYAVGRGHDPSSAESLTRAELIEQYGD